MKPFYIVLLAAFCFLAGCVGYNSMSSNGGIRVAVFQCDVTPPLGHPLCGGWIQPLTNVDEPLLAKGIVIEQNHDRYVLCSVDWCLLQTGAHDLFCRKLAEAAEVPVSHVSVHTVHQHNAPIADINAQLLLAANPSAPPHLDLLFMTNVTDRAAGALRKSLGAMSPVTQVAYGRAKVDRFASSRRARLADGVVHVRYSSTKDPELQAAAEGLIDPWLRTVTLLDGARPLVRLHFYASHPQSYYGDGRATSDTVGLARQQLEREEGVPQIYFTGCAGNVTAGKYNDGSPQARIDLTGRIHDAMQRSIAASTNMAASDLNWATENIELALRREPEWSEAAARRSMANTNASKVERISAALNLAWTRRVKSHPEVQLHRLKIGPVSLLLLPGEAFVEYQLYAHSLRSDDFLAVAAYGEAGPGYICCDEALKEGGYEPTDSRVGPPSEWRLKAGIFKLLDGASDRNSLPFYGDKLRLLSWRDQDGRERPIEKSEDWPKRRGHILAAMEQVMGPLPPPASGAPRVRVLEEVRLDRGVRRKLLLEVGASNYVPAYLFVPDGAGRRPAMLCLHQTTAEGKAEPAGISGRTNLHYGLELFERGYVTLAPDYPNFGDYRRDAYAAGFVSATMQGIVNHRRAVDYLVSLPEVDPERVGVIGHSLGGHNALFLAAFDSRIKAVVSSCGFNSFFKYYGGDLRGWSHAAYMPRIQDLYDCDPKLMPFDFTEVLAAIAPRAVFINAPLHDANFELSGVKDCLAAAGPVYHLLRAQDRLAAIHPDDGHGFPPEARKGAYEWLDRQMKAGVQR